MLFCFVRVSDLSYASGSCKTDIFSWLLPPSLVLPLDKIKLLAIMNDVLCSPIATVARKADPSKKHLVEQLANRFIQDLQNWASSAACLRPSAIASFSLLPEGIQGAKRWKIGTICGYSNMIITLLRAALRNVQSNIKVRLSFTQATLAALDATAPSKPDRLTLFYDSLVWAAKA